MKRLIQSILPVVVLAFSASAHGQFYKIATLKGGSISVGGTGQFTTTLTANPNDSVLAVAGPTGFTNQTVSNNRQYTTMSAGFLTSAQFHPKPWAGVEFNYGFTRYSERYAFNYSSTAATQTVSVPTDAHEATAAYVFHPKHIKFQPFMNIGGGAIDFTPASAANQWRAAGLVEVGFDIPTSDKHLAFRVEGRTLLYRAPNFNTPSISTRSWRSTEEPSFSAVYRF
jgi:hypothetical protein